MDSINIEYKDEITGDYVALYSEKLDIMTYIDLCRVPRAGAVSVFLGTTRDVFESKVVTYLSYEAYPEMAIESMKEIIVQIRSKWSVQRVVCVHKLGVCPVSEVSVLIAVSSEHRSESLAATDFAINELKKIVPIWKKEHYENGETLWKENQEAK